MAIKRAEEEAGKTFRQYQLWAHKWRDRGYVHCPHCKRQVTRCPHCKGDMLLEKAQKYPDMTVSWGHAFVECKEGKEFWPINDVSPIQEEAMGKAKEAYLYLALGDGRAPKGREAWLIPWGEFEAVREKMQGEKRGAIRFEGTLRSKNPTAKELFKESDRLEWTNGGWIIPEGHPFWAGKSLTGKVSEAK